MKLVPSPDERDFAAMLADLLAKQCPTTLVRSLAEPGADRFPKLLWDTLVASGILGLPFAEEHGGSGGTLDELGVFATEAGRALCRSPSVSASTDSVPTSSVRVISPRSATANGGAPWRCGTSPTPVTSRRD